MRFLCHYFSMLKLLCRKPLLPWLFTPIYHYLQHLPKPPETPPQASQRERPRLSFWSLYDASQANTGHLCSTEKRKGLCWLPSVLPGSVEQDTTSSVVTSAAGEVVGKSGGALVSTTVSGKISFSVPAIVGGAEVSPVLIAGISGAVVSGGRVLFVSRTAVSAVGCTSEVAWGAKVVSVKCSEETGAFVVVVAVVVVVTGGAA